MRLFSRKNGWFRIAKLAYFDEIGDMQKTVDELCRPLLDCQTALEVSREQEQDVETQKLSLKAGLSIINIPSSPLVDQESTIYIHDEEDDEGLAYNTTTPIDPLSNRRIDEINKEMHEFGLSRFAINENILAERADVNELLSLLSLDELKVCFLSELALHRD